MMTRSSVAGGRAHVWCRDHVASVGADARDADGSWLVDVYVPCGSWPGWHALRVWAETPLGAAHAALVIAPHSPLGRA